MLSIENINKKFVNFELIDISFNVKNKEIVSLIGPSGSGKSTIMNLIMGTLKPDSGNIIKPKKISIVYQENILIPHQTPITNLELALNRKISDDDYNIINEFDIPTNIKITNLSGGQRRKVCLLIGLLSNPDVLLLDEPFSSIDEMQVRELLWVIRKYLKHKRITCLVITHNIKEAFYLSSKVVMIKDGKIKQIGTPKEIYNNPQSEWICLFSGDVNIVKRSLLENTNDDSILYIRPENINICNGDEFKIHHKSFMGEYYDIIIYNDNLRLKVKSTKDYRVGERVNITYNETIVKKGN